MKRILFVIVLVSVLFSGCATPELATTTGVVVSIEAISFDAVYMTAVLETAPLAVPLILMVVGAGATEESMSTIIDSGGCTPDTSRSFISPEAAFTNYATCGHVVTDGEESKIKSRVRAAKQAEGKTPSGCYVREKGIATNGDEIAEAVILFFDSPYKGSSHKYSGPMFVHNITSPNRSTFDGVAKPGDAQWKGFSSADKDPRCGQALKFMSEVIAELRMTSYWGE